VALEDVGVASLRVMRTICDLRHRLQSIASADRTDELLATVSLLVESAKCRGADLVYTAVTRLPANRALFAELHERGPSHARRFLLSSRTSLEHKAVAAYIVAGIRQPKTRFAPALESRALWRAYLELGASQEAVDLCEAAYRVTNSGLALLLPIVAAAHLEPGRVVEFDAGPIHLTRDIPLYALDRHTRVGKAAIADWRTHSTSLGRYSPKAVALAVFYTEGGVPSRQYCWAETEHLTRIGLEADFASAGVAPPDIARLLRIARRERPTLNRFRRRHLRAAMGPVQLNLFEAEEGDDG